jgi:hypothetical protein
MRKLFILFLLIWVGVARAETVYFVGGLPNTTKSSSPEGACALGYAGDPNMTFAYYRASDGACIIKDSSGNFWRGSYVESMQMAPCPSGQVRQPNGTCGVPPPPPCSSPAGSSVSWSGKTGHSASPDAEQGDGPGSMPTSSPSCGISGTPKVEDCWSVPASDGGQDFFCKFSATSNGQQAPTGTPADGGAKPSGAKATNMPPTKADSSGNCPGGSTQGGVDSGGTPICIGSGTNPTGANGGARGDANPTSSTTTKTTDANGNKVTTTTGTRDNGDGSKTVTKTVETEAPDGSKSSTTTQTTGLTPGGKQGQPDKPETDFCRQHPELNVCRNSSIAGQCGQITCMGDAIQCATLRAAAAMQCAQEKDAEALKAMPSKALGDQIMSGADPMKGQIDDALKGTEIDVGAASLDQSGFLGGGSCLADKSLSVMGTTVTISFSSVCERIQPLRAAVMGCAFIIAYLLVSRSVLGS